MAIFYKDVKKTPFSYKILTKFPQTISHKQNWLSVIVFMVPYPINVLNNSFTRFCTEEDTVLRVAIMIYYMLCCYMLSCYIIMLSCYVCYNDVRLL